MQLGLRRVRRKALVLANSSYMGAAKLNNPINDATDIAEKLNICGFATSLKVDFNKDEASKVSTDFLDQLSATDELIVYYSGHGIQIDGRNFIVPIGFENSGDLSDLFDLSSFVSIACQKSAKCIVLLDACRTNPFDLDDIHEIDGSKKITVGDVLEVTSKEFCGLAEFESLEGECFFGFAAAPGRVAIDGAGILSPFTQSISNHILNPGIDILEVMQRVGKSVREITENRQVPWSNSSLTTDFRIAPKSRKIYILAALLFFLSSFFSSYISVINFIKYDYLKQIFIGINFSIPIFILIKYKFSNMAHFFVIVFSIMSIFLFNYLENFLYKKFEIDKNDELYVMVFDGKKEIDSSINNLLKNVQFESSEVLRIRNSIDYFFDDLNVDSSIEQIRNVISDWKTKNNVTESNDDVTFNEDEVGKKIKAQDLNEALETIKKSERRYIERLQDLDKNIAGKDLLVHTAIGFVVGAISGFALFISCALAIPAFRSAFGALIVLLFGGFSVAVGILLQPFMIHQLILQNLLTTGLWQLAMGMCFAACLDSFVTNDDYVWRPLFQPLKMNKYFWRVIVAVIASAILCSLFGPAIESVVVPSNFSSPDNNAFYMIREMVGRIDIFPLTASNWVPGALFGLVFTFVWYSFGERDLGRLVLAFFTVVAAWISAHYFVSRNAKEFDLSGLLILAGIIGAVISASGPAMLGTHFRELGTWVLIVGSGAGSVVIFIFFCWVLRIDIVDALTDATYLLYVPWQTLVIIAVIYGFQQSIPKNEN